MNSFGMDRVLERNPWHERPDQCPDRFLHRRYRQPQLVPLRTLCRYVIRKICKSIWVHNTRILQSLITGLGFRDITLFHIIFRLLFYQRRMRGHEISHLSRWHWTNTLHRPITSHRKNLEAAITAQLWSCLENYSACRFENIYSQGLWSSVAILEIYQTIWITTASRPEVMVHYKAYI